MLDAKLIVLAAKIAGGAIALGGVAWLADEIGDRREAKVRAEYAAGIAAANRRAAEAQEKWRAHYEAQLAERMQVMGEIKAAIDRKQPGDDISAEVLRKLNSIRPARRQ